MTNLIKKVKSCISDKIDAWKYKDSVSLVYDNPLLFELKWTSEHFKDIYEIAKDKGLIKAIKYDLFVTLARHYLNKGEIKW